MVAIGKNMNGELVPSGLVANRRKFFESLRNKKVNNTRKNKKINTKINNVRPNYNPEANRFNDPYFRNRGYTGGRRGRKSKKSRKTRKTRRSRK